MKKLIKRNFSNKTIRIVQKKRIRSIIIFDKKIAIFGTKMKYYEALASEMTQISFRERERKRLSTSRRERVTDLIDAYNLKLDEMSQGTFNTLQGLYKKNKEAAFSGKDPPINSNLLYLVSSLPLLVTAYRKIRGNKGALTLAYTLSDDRYNRTNSWQKSYLNKTFRSPDGISKEILIETSRLLRKGEYPWGSSRRIYVDKPGRPGALRPITIPPFMDRVVQTAILMVLEAIYEPWFEKLNCSFGFRPRKGVHDAIYSLANNGSRGFFSAIEGDIKGAYDLVCKNTMISILQKRIKDRKFIDLIKKRLDYEFFDTVKNKHVVEPLGVPQGGIDSPYLWNIYMANFDEFVLSKTKEIFDKLNNKHGSPNYRLGKGQAPAERRKLERSRTTLRWMVRVLNRFPNQEDAPIISTIFQKKSVPGFEVEIKELRGLREFLKEATGDIPLNKGANVSSLKFNLIKMNRKKTHEFFKFPPSEPSRRILRFKYVRYADDWILLSNAPIYVMNQLKLIFADFLKDQLKATLSDEKTLITDIRKTPAHFLGFQIQAPSHYGVGRYIRYNRLIKANVSGKEVYFLPDKQRIINRLHMKGYCTDKGFPKEIPWISHVEAFAIIERYNAVLRGFCNYYTEFVNNPGRQLSRWVYIIRYSCIKTLAQKYSTSIGGLFKKLAYKFSRSEDNKSRTIAVTINQVIKGKTYQKTWRLLTLKELIKSAREINRKEDVATRYWNLEKGIPPTYDPSSGSFATVKDDNFLDKIKMVNLRTSASFDLPCCMCGSSDNINMHHIKHVRHTKYELIPREQVWARTMSLRNRKQIPLCRECHMNVVHRGKYGGTKLSTYVPKIMYDNRLITIEGHINSDRTEKLYLKTLQDKGWMLQHQNSHQQQNEYE